MGFVSIASLLIVQDSLKTENLGTATASQQFARTIGGTIGVGISGSLLNARFIGTLSESGLGGSLPPGIGEKIRQNIEQIFRPDIQSLISADALRILQETVGQGVSIGLLGIRRSVSAVLDFLLTLATSNRHIPELSV